MLVETEGRHDGSNWAAVSQQGYDCDHQLVRLVRPIEGGSFGLGKGFLAPLAFVAALFLVEDCIVTLARSAVGPATFVVAEYIERLYVRILSSAPEPVRMLQDLLTLQLHARPRSSGYYR